MARALTKAQRMEQYILKTERERLWRPFMQAVRRYGLIRPGDRVAVCVSGGKDSTLLALMMDMLRRRGEIPFQAVNLVMDPGYRPEVRRDIEANLRALGIDYTLFESDVLAAAEAQDANPCFLCARMRRGCLYGRAQALGCNRIALGHHYDDVIETVLMAMLYGGQIQGMPPLRRAEHFPGMALIRPLYRVREADTLAWRDAFGLSFPGCACRFAGDAAAGARVSRRKSVKALIAALAQDDPKVPANLFNSVHRVDLDSLVGWKQREERHTVMEAFQADDPAPAEPERR